MKLERTVEPSRIRRGRWATSPVWYVSDDTGNRWRFTRKRDAVEYMDQVTRGATFSDDPPGGFMVERAGVRL